MENYKPNSSNYNESPLEVNNRKFTLEHEVASNQHLIENKSDVLKTLNNKISNLRMALVGAREREFEKKSKLKNIKEIEKVIIELRIDKAEAKLKNLEFDEVLISQLQAEKLTDEQLLHTDQMILENTPEDIIELDKERSLLEESIIATKLIESKYQQN
jgi:hypothetical protein